MSNEKTREQSRRAVVIHKFALIVILLRGPSQESCHILGHLGLRGLRAVVELDSIRRNRRRHGNLSAREIDIVVPGK